METQKLSEQQQKKLENLYVDQSEKYITSLGNGYLANYLTTATAKKGFAVITNKRVYFKGECLSGQGKHLTKTNEERAVDLGDITGSGFVQHRNFVYLIISAIMFIVPLLFIVSIIVPLIVSTIM